MAQAIDFYLRCNSLSCRAVLKARAVVTTCSLDLCYSDIYNNIANWSIDIYFACNAQMNLDSLDQLQMIDVVPRVKPAFLIKMMPFLRF